MEDDSRNIELEQKIDAYIKGKLTEAEVEDLWVELLEKPEYIALLETEIDVARVYKAKEQQKSTTIHYWKWVAAAAAVALLVISINLLSDHSPQKPIKEWAQSQINLSRNLASAEVTRSQSIISTPDSLLNIGFKAAIEGKTQKATEIYTNITTRFDDPEVIAKARLNLGLIRYNAESYNRSIKNFNQAIALSRDNALLKERAYWYLAHAFIHINQLKAARSAVQQAYLLDGIYKDKAFSLLKRLDYELGNIDYDSYKQQINETE